MAAARRSAATRRAELLAAGVRLAVRRRVAAIVALEEIPAEHRQPADDALVIRLLDDLAYLGEATHPDRVRERAA